MRLTSWNGKKWVLPQGRYWRAIADRLAAYENTGYEPEEIGTYEAIKAQAAKLGYRLVRTADYSCACVSEYPRTARCAGTHVFVRKSKTGQYTYCRLREEGVE